MKNYDEKRSEKLLNLYSGAITDIMDALSPDYRNQTLPSNLRPLTPDMKIAGPVYTVRGNKRFYDDGEDPRYKQMDMLDGIFPGSIIIMDSGDEKSAAHWGELMSKTSMEKGAKGALIHGGIRDTDEIIKHKFPVFACYHSPLTAVYRYNIIDFNNPPPTQPSLWCNFTYDSSKKAVVWNGNDKTRNGIEWINYILNLLLKNGYEMRGKMDWEGEEFQDRGTINVDGKEVIVKDAVSPNQFTAEQVENMKVNELRDALKSLGADSKGLKSILKERMILIISQKQYNYDSGSDSEYDYY